MSSDQLQGGGEAEASGDRAIAAGGSIAVAVSGDNARVVMLPTEAVHWARTVQVPVGAGFLPRSASGVFIGRERELANLRHMLTGEGAAAVTQAPARAIHGLGGVGKSTLALQYAHRFRDTYNLVWWLTAESAESIVGSLARLTMHLCPQWAGTVGRDERAAWALLWLQEHPNWLLVFDNVEDPVHLHPYLGSLNRGHHLATSRIATGWHAVAPTMGLGLLAVAEATDLLCALAFPQRPPTGQEREAAEELARALGCLPLALEQAGAYAYETCIDLRIYRQSLGLVLDEASMGVDPKRTIARIWDHTLTAIADHTSLAVTILHAMAWLAPDNIPRKLLEPLATSPIALNRALGVLHAYNMIAFAEQGSVSVHRLVQTVLRTRDTPPSGRHDAEYAVYKALPRDDEAPAVAGQWQQFLPHVTTLAETSPPGHTAAPETVAAYSDAGHYLRQQGRDAHSIPLRQAVHAWHEQVLGGMHRDTLVSRNNLALAYRAAGDLGQAISLIESTLSQSEQTLGDRHPDTLAVRNSLATAYHSAGDLKRAIPLYETTLKQREQVLGDTHPYTLNTRNNLAFAYKTAGDLRRAIPLYETTLTQRKQVLGDIHPDTLSSCNNLARAYEAARDLERAIPLYENTLAHCEQVLGDTHPDTLMSRGNLAHAYQAAGDLSRATLLFESTLSQRERVLRDTHPDTLTSRGNLADVYHAAGDLRRAIPLYEATLAQREQVLGNAHPDTLTSRATLAGAYASASDLQRAIPLYEGTLSQSRQVLGATHPETLSVCSDLALAYKLAGDLGRAIPLYEATLAQCELALGSAHHITLVVRNGLGAAYESAGDLGRAIPLYESAFSQSEQVLGNDHPDTGIHRISLAAAYESAGYLARAIPLYEATLAQLRQGMGDTHSNTVVIRDRLARLRQSVQSADQPDTATPPAESGQQCPPRTSEELSE